MISKSKLDSNDIQKLFLFHSCLNKYSLLLSIELTFLNNAALHSYICSKALYKGITTDLPYDLTDMQGYAATLLLGKKYLTYLKISTMRKR